MGFDLMGLSPDNPLKVQKPTMDPDNHTAEDLEAYFEQMTAYRAAVDGDYFRNNVWWWRPMWDYVCEKYKDTLTATDNTMGHENSGHIICKEKAKRIATKLNNEIEDGSIKKMCMKYETDRKVLIESNCDSAKAKFAFNYPMSVNNFQAFADFCKHSGGFEIW
tara:strand:- start:10038 stop:10526 length:489 start_codon:yes stop_codon:yes gene_type:complete